MPHQPFVRTLRAQWLGQQLRTLREQRQMTLQLVAQHLGRDLSALGRYERAEWPIGRATVVALLDLYGLHQADQRAWLLEIAERVWHVHHWDGDHRDEVDVSFITHGWLTEQATKVYSYVPTLTDRRGRPRIAAWPGTARVEMILDETALHGTSSDLGLRRAHMAQVVQAMRRPNVEMQVLPARAGLHAGVDGPFTIFAMPKPYPPVGHLDTLAGRLYVEAPISEWFADAYQRIRQMTLDPHQSAKLITAAAEQEP